MSRHEQRVSDLVDLGYRLDRAEALAHAEQIERIELALERIARAIESDKVIFPDFDDLDEIRQGMTE